MKLRILDADLRRLDLGTRMPFRYGIVTMTHSPHVFLRLTVDIDGTPITGVAADHLPPKWFTKDPARAIADEIDEMLRVIRHAMAEAVGILAGSAFDAWQTVYFAQSEWGRSQGLPPLLTQFGSSLVERALIEAVCRRTSTPFARLLRQDGLGIRLGAIHPELEGRRPAEFLHPRPRPFVRARHTVGLLDPLEDGDIPETERLDDGLPQSLAACTDYYGLLDFKVKLSGDPAADRVRLGRLAHVLGEHAPSGYRLTLDGNEQFRTAAEFRDFWEAVSAEPELTEFLGHLRFVEQPLHRSVALDPATVGGLCDWPGRPPLIIDESDDDLDCLPRALELGYIGTSHKNCKGIFKSVANACLLEHRRADAPVQLRFSGEDLANIGPVALLQDLAVCAALGIKSVERNGHHYFAGLSMFPTRVQRQVLEAHPELYEASRDGWPTLAVRQGELDLAGVNRAPLGVGFRLDVEQFAAAGGDAA